MKIDFWDLTSCHLTSYIPCLALTYLLFTLLPLLTHSLRSLVPRVVMRGMRSEWPKRTSGTWRAMMTRGLEWLKMAHSVGSLRFINSFPHPFCHVTLRSVLYVLFPYRSWPKGAEREGKRIRDGPWWVRRK